ncbi:MAG TPA: Gfo/Idh/MocA family oxidoreductase [Vicinamibacteria bacterium]|nr:Gfo/Idh/MocA family oxidoreductase [Vicinamibacteria bacterium]
MPERIRVGVVGIGELGSRHTRVYSEVAAARLVGVADVDGARARRVAEIHGGVEAVTDFRDLISKIDAASVAVPTVEHHRVARALVDAGIHVLVEKPITSRPEEAHALVERARVKGVRLAVGHTERYNPSVQALIEQAKDPRFIEIHRLGSFSPRSLDIDVVLDLMIHDLDVVTALVRQEVVSVDAVGVAVLTGRVDIANARLKFAGGAVANITASRVSREKVRKLRVFERDRYISLDYLKQEALRYRLSSEDGGRRPEIRQDELSFCRGEPLRIEIEDFLGSIRGGHEPRVRGEDGLRALELARRVADAMRGGGGGEL